MDKKVIIYLNIAQFLSNEIDVTDLIYHGMLSCIAISPLFVDRFGRSLRVCNLEFDKETISFGL